MKKLERTDLACEKSKNIISDYDTFMEEVFGISILCSRKRIDPSSESSILTVGNVWMYNEEYRKNASLAISTKIKEYTNTGSSKGKKILIVGLGNRFITSDALGSYVINELYPTIRIEGFENKIYLLAPGVEGQTGIATFDIITGAIGLSSADLVIVIDSLCSKRTERLLTTIQISTEGIMPGSGVGNHKKEISKNTVGVPVIWIGTPTVTDLNQFESTDLKYYVTPNDIDISLKSISKIIAKGIEIALYK